MIPFRTIRLWLALAGTGLIPSMEAADAINYRVVAVTGERPFTGIGFVEFAAFFDAGLISQSPAINEFGQVALWARLSGGGYIEGVSSDVLLYRDPGAAGWQLIVRQGDPVSGGGAGTYGVFERPQIDRNEEVCFKGITDGVGGFVDEVVYIWSPGGGDPELFFEETNSEVTPSLRLRIETSAVDLIQPDGYLAISTRLTGTAAVAGVNDYAVATRNVATGVIELSFRRGLPVLGTTLGIISKLAMEAEGGVNNTAFLTTLDGPAAGADTAIIVYRPNGTFVAAARENEAAPGTGGAVFADLASAEIAYNGSKVAFTATLTGAGVNLSNDRGLWVGSPDAPVLRLREGDPAPGLPGMTTGFISTVALNAEGRLGFRAGVAPGAFAVYLEDDAGEFVPVGYPGMVSPKADDNRVVGATYFFNGPSGLSDSGEIVFTVQFPGAEMMVLTAKILPDSTKPRVRVTGGKRVTTDQPRYRLRGRANDNDELDHVEVRIGKGKWRKAKGLKRWRTRKPLILGTEKVRVRVRAIDATGNVSRIKRQTITPQPVE